MNSEQNLAAAATYGTFVLAAYEMFTPGALNPPPGPNFPKGYELVATIQMSDAASIAAREFYGFIAASTSAPSTTVLALRGTEGLLEWWDDFHWALTPFERVPGAGNVAVGFYDIYRSIGLMTPESTAAESVPSRSIAADVAGVMRAIASDIPPPAPAVMAAHSLGAALVSMLVLDMVQNGLLDSPPTVFTFASPRVGDATFAAAYDALFSGPGVAASYRIVNAFDLVPLFPTDPPFVHVASEVTIESIGKAYFSVPCNHTLRTYLHVLDPSIPLDAGCVPTSLDRAP